MSVLNGKVAIVTGGASGIGEATVREMAKEGAKVVIADINEFNGNALAMELKDTGAEVMFIKTNLTVESEIEALVYETVKRFGRLDVLFNNAGTGALTPSHELTFEDWRKTLSLNLDGVFLMAKQAIKQMLVNGGGSIVNNASIHGHVGFPNHAAYTASKGGVVNLTRALAIEYGKDNIRINAVCPGFIMTPMIQAGLTPEMFPHVVALHPIGRIGEPIEVAKAVVFLASDSASFITGTSLMVDGGYTAQ